jgi:ribonuclease HII
LELQLRQWGISPLAGVDEAGVGAWAGPVVAAAVILPRDFLLAGLNDSKLLSERRRAALFDGIHECAVAVGVGQVEVAEKKPTEYLLGSKCWPVNVQSRR